MNNKKPDASKKVRAQRWFKMISFMNSPTADGALGLLECIKCGKIYEFEPLVEGEPPTECPECGYAGEFKSID
jgi:rubrerythrin